MTDAISYCAGAACPRGFCSSLSDGKEIGSHDRAFRRLGTSLESGGQQLHGVADQRRRNHRGRKPPLANPFLTGARDAITSGEWKAQPGIALARVP